MKGYQLNDFDKVDFSVAFTADTDNQLAEHFQKEDGQEDLTFAYWVPSRGVHRYTAILRLLALPDDDERILQGNVAFTSGYLSRVLDEGPADHGIALLHSHLGPGWQGMSDDDIVAERDRLAAVVASRTDLPLLGLTWGTDKSWSARFWLRAGRGDYRRRWAMTVRSVGVRLRTTYHPQLRPVPTPLESQMATRSVWGEEAQTELVRLRIGVVGLGSVGSIVAEGLSRIGIERITLIDYDVIEERNLDRTLGAYAEDVLTPKVAVSKRLLDHSHTAGVFSVDTIPESLLTTRGIKAALDCDVLISCVDRPWPRHVLNKLSYLHLIPVIDGGILARVNEHGKLVHVDWRIHTIGPERACLYCLGALRQSDAVLDRDGLLDDPDYLQGLSVVEREFFQRRNVFPFSLSVASHELLQLVRLATGNQRIGGIGPQRYRGYPGRMDVEGDEPPRADCDFAALTATALALIPESEVLNSLQGTSQLDRKLRWKWGSALQWIKARWSRWF